MSNELTPRERQVLELICDKGETYKDAAAQLGVSIATIGAHASHAYKKLDRSRFEIMVARATSGPRST